MSNDRIKILSEILEREFRKAKDIPADVDIDVRFTEDETIEVAFQCMEYVMEIGSDDDYFSFHEVEGDDHVKFDFPPDWLEEVE